MKRLLSDFVCLLFPRDDDEDYSWGTIIGVLMTIGVLVYLMVTLGT
jgi:hypothetical protein